MIYQKNVPGWERAMRVVAGVIMVGCGLYMFPGAPLGYLIAAAGVTTALTGFFGFCPMCAVAGRRLPSS
jgi:threonine/homoserine/homoserine lactone efflux protein